MTEREKLCFINGVIFRERVINLCHLECLVDSLLKAMDLDDVKSAADKANDLMEEMRVVLNEGGAPIRPLDS